MQELEHMSINMFLIRWLQKYRCEPNFSKYKHQKELDYHRMSVIYSIEGVWERCSNQIY